MLDTELIQVPSESVAVVRSVVPADGLADFFAQAYGRVAGAVPAAGGALGGPPFGWYHGMPGATVDVAAGFPVAGDVHDPDGDVHVVERPGGLALTAVLAGSYDRLGPAWGELGRDAAGRGLAPRGDCWEEYLNEPGADPRAQRTRLVLPVT